MPKELSITPRQKALTPDPETKTITIRNVPSEIADLFEAWVDVMSRRGRPDPRDREARKVWKPASPSEVFSKLVKQTFIDDIGQESYDRSIRLYRRDQEYYRNRLENNK